jgi:RNA polymerase sigma-70 factor (ECF subfamily)
MRLLPTRANGQPAFGHYIEELPGSDLARGTGLFVVSFRGERVDDFIRFAGADLLERCGLPDHVMLPGR